MARSFSNASAGKPGLLLCALVILMVPVLRLGECSRARMYFVGDTYESHNSITTLNSADCIDAVTITECDILAADESTYLVLNVTITAKEDIVLDRKVDLSKSAGFRVATLDVYADVLLSKGLNNGVDFLTGYALNSGEVATFNVVFNFDVSPNTLYSICLFEAVFEVEV